jgi:hypothetical protein
LAIARVLGTRTLAALLFDSRLDLEGAALAAIGARLLFSSGIARVFIGVFFGSICWFNDAN